MPKMDTVSWNTVLDGYSKSGEMDVAFELFERMPERFVPYGRWQAQITSKGQRLSLGAFNSQEEAAKAYDIAAIKIRGHNTTTNFDMSHYDVNNMLESSTLSIANCVAKRLKGSSSGSGVALVASQLTEDVRFGSYDGGRAHQQMTRLAKEKFANAESLSLMSLSPLDGCYLGKTGHLRPFFSEYGLICFRVHVEIKWLLKLSQICEIKEVPIFSKDAQSFLEKIILDFNIIDALEVKEIEKVTNHDMKAVEYFLKHKCKSCPEVAEVVEFFHFACTSEDVNNLALALSLKKALNFVVFPIMIELCEAIRKMAKENAHIPMLSRTHGQPASPTTLGKEMANFAVRLSDQGKIFPNIMISGKFAGAVGNYNAHKVAYSNVNWPEIAEDFVRSLGIKFNPYIEPHDYIAKLFNTIIQFNNILTDFDRDVWSYISLGYFKQISKAGEIGSSTMPHKVNPFDFENSEDNLVMANAILSPLSMKLPISRMQRDLTDSTLLRNLGVGLGHCILAYTNALQGIGKLQVNESRLNEDLEQTWEVLAEPIQTAMQRYAVPEPYEKLKELTRGKNVTKESIQKFIKGLNIPEESIDQLLQLSPRSYIGEAEELAKAVDNAVDLVNGFRIL